MEALSGPREVDQAGSPMAAAGHRSSKMEGLGQTHLDHSTDLLLSVDLHSSSLGPSGHSTFLHGCSREGKEGGAGLGQTEAGGAKFKTCVRSSLSVVSRQYQCPAQISLTLTKSAKKSVIYHELPPTPSARTHEIRFRVALTH